MGNISITMSCGTCRKAKMGLMAGRNGMYTCKHKNDESEFYIFGSTPCENWLPSKTDVRLWIKRSKKSTSKTLNVGDDR